MNDHSTEDYIEKLISGELTEEEQAAINDILQNSPEARTEYLQKTRLELNLQNHYTEIAPLHLQAGESETSANVIRWKKFTYPAVAAACVMFGFFLALALQDKPDHSGNGQGTTQVIPNTAQRDAPDYDIGPIAGSSQIHIQKTPNNSNLKQTWLDQLGTAHFKQGYGKAQINCSVEKDPLVTAGVKHHRGIGTHSDSVAIYQLTEGTLNFRAAVGLSDAVVGKVWQGKKAGCIFRVVGDGRVLWESGPMRAGDKVKIVNIPLTGVKELRLIVDKGVDGTTFDHANWLEASFLHLEAAPIPKPWVIDHSSFILTPQPGPAPKINGAKVIGGTPGKPFLFRVPTTGNRPITFRAKNLPDGIHLDSKNGILTGKVPVKGTYHITLYAENTFGKAKRELRLVSGNTLALTPPMGWNSWYCWSESISSEKVADIAQALVDTGLADHGWTYVNIDDCWQDKRAGPLNAIQANARFPDMKNLCDTVHRHGLKIGIYSTPWVSSYAGFIGGSSPNVSGASPELHIDPKKRHQPTQVYGRWPSFHKLKLDRVGKYWFCDQDAKQWADWGFDYVKYDWKPNDIPTTKRLLAGLQKSGRDIVYSLSNDTPFKNAQGISELANLWRTGGDIHDNWNAILRNGFHKSQWAPYSKPGHWNDPDMLQLGMKGTPNNYIRQLKPTHLTPHEQYSHMSLWCLLSAPLMLSCDVANMDTFTLSLLTNDEVIAVNQDSLGKSATPLKGNKELWLKELEDGAYALGIFNLSDEKRTIHVDINQLNLPKGKWMARDLWRQKNLGIISDTFRTEVHRHGVTLIKLYKK